MGAEVALTPRARLDLIDIWDFAADGGAAAADRVLDRIEATLATLAGRPLMGRARPELAPDLRSFPVGAVVLFYRPSPTGVVLIRALSRYRDVQSGDMDEPA